MKFVKEQIKILTKVKNTFMDQTVKPKNSELTKFVEENGVTYIQEGKAKILTKKVTEVSSTKKIEEQVFYNPVQIFNRDFTVLAISTFAKQKDYKINILDALSASGLRSIRFAKELDQQYVGKIYANDISTASLVLIKENVELNNLAADQITIHHMDANRLLFESSLGLNTKFDVIDLDPYGSVGPFLDAAIHACNNDNGRETLLCITCTDSRVLCGPDTQKCFSQYGTARVKMTCFAENGLRTLLYTIATAAGKIGKTMTPLLSIYGEFYLRVFVSIKRDKPGCHKLITQVGNILYCPQCTAYKVYPYGEEQLTDKKNVIYRNSKQQIDGICGICESKMKISNNSKQNQDGPLWIDQINDGDFVTKMQLDLLNFKETFQAYHKLDGKLQGIQNQLRFEKIPLSYNFNWIGSHLKCSNMSKKEIYSGVQSLGFDIASSYIQTDEYKTNCPPDVIYDIVKTWKSQKQGGDKYLLNIQPDSYQHKILTAPVVHNPDFTSKPKNLEHIKQFYPNPEKFWGPKARAVQKKVIESEENFEGDLQKKVKLDDVPQNK